MPDLFLANRRKKVQNGGLLGSESRALGSKELVFRVKRACVFGKRRKHSPRKTQAFPENDYFFFKYLYMFSMITYIVLFKDGFFSVFLSGCLTDTELSFLPERCSRCFRVDDMIQKEPFTAQYASYIDKCDQSDRRKNELEPFFPSCLSLGAKE